MASKYEGAARTDSCEVRTYILDMVRGLAVMAKDAGEADLALGLAEALRSPPVIDASQAGAPVRAAGKRASGAGN